MATEKLYYSIGEVSEMLGVSPSMLRFWETEFPQLRPAKNSKGTRSYTSNDIVLLRRIIYLSKECGLTLEGTRQQLKKDNNIDKTIQITDTLNELKKILLKVKQKL